MDDWLAKFKKTQNKINNNVRNMIKYSTKLEHMCLV